MNDVYEPRPPHRAWIFRASRVLEGMSPAEFFLWVMVGFAVVAAGVALLWVGVAIVKG